MQNSKVKIKAEKTFDFYPPTGRLNFKKF